MSAHERQKEVSCKVSAFTFYKEIDMAFSKEVTGVRQGFNNLNAHVPH